MLVGCRRRLPRNEEQQVQRCDYSDLDSLQSKQTTAVTSDRHWATSVDSDASRRCAWCRNANVDGEQGRHWQVQQAECRTAESSPVPFDSLIRVVYRWSSRRFSWYSVRRLAGEGSTTGTQTLEQIVLQSGRMAQDDHIGIQEHDEKWHRHQARTDVK